MSDQSKPVQGAAAPEGSPAPADDRIKNLQKEFDRKLTNIEQTLKSSNEQLLSFLQGQQKANSRPAPEPEVDIENLIYTKPAEAVRKIKEDAKAEIRAELNSRDQETAKRNSVVQSLYKDFPELAIDDHPLTKLALEKFDSLSKEYGNSPATYKAAVAEAALEQGVKPKSKRSDEENDAYQLSGSSQSRGRPKKASEDISPATEMAARLLGVDPEKVKARAKGRKNFGNWE